MRSGERELEMESRSTVPKHDAVKTFVVFEASDFLQSEAFAVPVDRSLQVADWTSNAQMRVHDFDECEFERPNE